ncbi:MAG: hypothetical protein WCD49_18295 [Candidatus Acidiferrales bacterium]
MANAVATKITEPRYGMTLPQFQAYGVAVSEILQTNHTYLVLIGISSAIADAMPPRNADGSVNQSAQGLAVSQIVDAVIAGGFAPTPANVTPQDLEWFTLDLVAAMNHNDGMMQLMTPGVGLRIIDSYVVTGTSNGSVNWPQVNASLTNAVQSFITAGLMKIPANQTPVQVETFVSSVAQAIYAYKVSTNRATL